MSTVPVTVETLHHVALPAHDVEAMKRFPVRLLGFEADADKPDWSRAGDGFNAHRMAPESEPEPASVERRSTLPVASRPGLVVHLLAANLHPRPASLDARAERAGLEASSVEAPGWRRPSPPCRSRASSVHVIAFP